MLIRIKERGEAKDEIEGRVCGAKVGKTDVWEATFPLNSKTSLSMVFRW